MVLLQVRRFVAGAVDAYNNPTRGYGDPSPWPVWWVAPGAVQEVTTGRDASVVAFTIGAPKSALAPTERDLVVVDGDEYEVEGRPADWTRGPWQNRAAGIVVELRRVNG